MRQPAESGAVDPARIKRWQELLASERDAAALYSRLAEAETGERQKIFEELAGVERRHAGHWERKLADAGARVPPPGRPSLRTTVIAAAARRLSAQAVLPMVERAERSDAGIYDLDPDAAPGMAEDERGHARTLAKLIGGRPDPALVAAIGLAAAALLAVGAGIGTLNGRPTLRSGARQLLVGGIAAAVTFGVGHLIGGAVS